VCGVLWKESLSSDVDIDGNIDQDQQQPFISNHWTKKKKPTAYGIGILDPALRHAQ
jgi:hypothetical protein